MRWIDCGRCGRHRQLMARGLCSGCYSYVLQAGKLDQYPTLDEQLGQLRTADVLRLLGGAISERQLDYWLRRGFFGQVDNADGCGSRRRFSERDVELIRQIAGEWNEARARLDDIGSGRRWAQLCEQEPAR